MAIRQHPNNELYGIALCLLKIDISSLRFEKLKKYKNKKIYKKRKITPFFINEKMFELLYYYRRDRFSDYTCVCSHYSNGIDI